MNPEICDECGWDQGRHNINCSEVPSERRAEILAKLRSKTFKIEDFELHLMPNDDGGIRNAYLGLYDSEGHYRGSLDGQALARLAKALGPYAEADLEPALQG